MSKLKQKTYNYLRELIANETKMHVSEIQDERGFEDYGVDSVMVVAMTRELEKVFGELSKTLFFEYRSLSELADYFLEDYQETLQELFQLDSQDDKNELVDVIAHPYTQANNFTNQDIAIIGMSGRFPKANNLFEYWKNLKEGRDCISEIPADRWDYKDYYSEERGEPGTSYSIWGGHMDDIDKFDPLFFNISNLEAEGLDPQERLFLQTVYHTLEDAGYTKQSLAKKNVGVYVGIMWGLYTLYGADFANAGSSFSSIANRVSYYFDFQGPSIGLDTMCSSSLTTMHLACESIRSGESDLAIAGGVNITTHPYKYIMLSQTGFASSDGRCRSFGKDGDGYVPADCVGAVLLKPLALAEKDKDYIYGVIKASSLNHDGRTNGYTVPNPKAQANLIQSAFAKTDVPPRSISYIEAHSAGTALGDPIELKGLADVFKAANNDQAYCAVGSVKSNIGHAESAAGFAGVAKVLMQMRYRKLAPSIHIDELNPNIKLTNTAFHIQKELSEWKKPVYLEDGQVLTAPRRAGVNAFGAGGANAHMILEEYENNLFNKQNGSKLFVLSARDSERLQEYVENFQDYLSQELPYIYREAWSSVQQKINTSEQTLTQAVLDILSKVLNLADGLLEVDDELLDYGCSQAALDKVATWAAASYGLALSDLQLDNLLTPKAIVNNLFDAITKYNQSVITQTNNLEDLLPSIAYTLQVGRESMQVRLAIVADSLQDIMDGLNCYLHGIEHDNVYVSENGTDIPNVDNELLIELFQRQRYKKLAKLWCRGVNIDWKNLHGEQKQQKLPLPGYPFAKERCWVAQPSLPDRQRKQSAKPLQIASSENQISEDPLKDFFYQPEWQEVNFPKNSHTQKNHNALVIYDDETYFIKELVIKNLPGHHVDILMADDLANLDVAYDEYDEIFFMPGLSVSAFNPNDEQAFAHAQRFGLEALFLLFKQLQVRQYSGRLCVFTSNGAKVGSEAVNPYARSLIGLVKAASKEIPKIFLFGLDLDIVDKNLPEIEVELEKSLIALGSYNVAAGDYALRQEKFYKQSLVKTALSSITTSALVANGTYVIIGGSGVVGRKLTTYLGQSASANVIWLGRRELDAKLEQQIGELAQSGAKISYYATDIADIARISATLTEINQTYGKIHGVFHSAMDFEFKQIKDLSLEQFTSMIKAKVLGSFNLQKALNNCAVDRLIMFSSGESFIGNVGWSAYAAACNFKDAIADYLQDTVNYTVQIINWGFWEDNKEGLDDSLAAKGIYPITAAEGMNVVERMLSSDRHQVMAWHVSNKVLQLVGIEVDEVEEIEKLVEPKLGDEVTSENKVELTDKKKQELRTALLERLTNVVANVLHIDAAKFEHDVDLATYGVDSLIVVNVHKAIESDFDTTFYATLLIENMTISAVADSLIERYPEVLMKTFKLLETGIPQAKTKSDTVVSINKNKLDQRVSLIKAVPDAGIEDYLRSYGEKYRNAKLIDKETIKDIDLSELDASSDSLCHLLVMTDIGKRAEVFSFGSGEPILFMPAVGLTAPVWLHQLKVFAQKNRVLVIHPAGYGLSELIPEINTKGIGEQIIDVLDKLGIQDNLHIVGSCFGGISMQYLANFYPGRVSSMTLACGFYENMPKEYGERLGMLQLTPPQLSDPSLFNKSPDELSIDQLAELGQMLGSSMEMDFNYITSKLPDYEKNTADYFEDCKTLLTSSQCASALVAMKYLNETLTISTLPWLTNINTPTLCIASQHDTMVNPATVEVMDNVLSKSEFEFFSGAGHYPFLTHVDKFNALLRRFIDSKSQSLKIEVDANVA